MSDNLKGCVSRIARLSEEDIEEQGIEEFRKFKQCVSELQRELHVVALCGVHDDDRLRVLEFLYSLAIAKHNLVKQIQSVLDVVMELGVWQDTLRRNGDSLKWPPGMRVTLPEELPSCDDGDDVGAFSGYITKSTDLHSVAAPSVDDAEVFEGTEAFSNDIESATGSDNAAVPCADDGDGVTCDHAVALSSSAIHMDNAELPSVSEVKATQLSGHARADADAFSTESEFHPGPARDAPPTHTIPHAHQYYAYPYSPPANSVGQRTVQSLDCQFLK
jgi:hypothetical protein